MRALLAGFFLFLVLGNAGLHAAERAAPGNRVRVENDVFVVSATPRTPEQIAAFYEGRKFPAPMIQRLKQVCFITIGIHNKSGEVLWHDLQHWQFISGKQVVRRYHRNEWKTEWAALKVPMANQSTFRWTLLPESLDFRPGEREGGNIILERTAGPFDIHARFVLGSDINKRPVDVIIENVRCAGNGK